MPGRNFNIGIDIFQGLSVVAGGYDYRPGYIDCHIGIDNYAGPSDIAAVEYYG